MLDSKRTQITELNGKLTAANARTAELELALRDIDGAIKIVREQRDIARQQLSEARFDLIDSTRKQLRFYGVPVVVSSNVPNGVLYHAFDRDVYYVTGEMYANLQNSLDKINSRDKTIARLTVETAALRAQLADVYAAAEKWQFSSVPTPFTAHTMLCDAASTIANLKRLATLQPTTGASNTAPGNAR
jgi:hypothetical protein